MFQHHRRLMKGERENFCRLLSGLYILWSEIRGGVIKNILFQFRRFTERKSVRKKRFFF
jgi:hypothetical protein